LWLVLINVHSSGIATYEFRMMNWFKWWW
jgi:hypothetical protein